MDKMVVYEKSISTMGIDVNVGVGAVNIGGDGSRIYIEIAKAPEYIIKVIDNKDKLIIEGYGTCEAKLIRKIAEHIIAKTGEFK